MAVVNGEAITLTDLRIVRMFGLVEEEEEGSELPLSICLERLIDQKLVIQLFPESQIIEREEMEAFEKKLKERMGEERIEEMFKEFGLDWKGLREYVKERILFKKLVSRKFSQTIPVSLIEIEEFYEKSYVPSQKEKGLEPRPMIEVIQEIESLIRKDKMRKQIREWISNLRKRADIQMRVRDLETYPLS